MIEESKEKSEQHKKKVTIIAKLSSFMYVCKRLFVRSIPCRRAAFA